MKLGVVICGVVERGRQIGRRIGFPTLNLPLRGVQPLPCGVYRSEVEIEGREGVWRAMSNLGYNPSVGGEELRLESHLFDFTGELYGARIRVRLIEKIRDEIRFESVEELQAQLEKDKEIILNR